MGNRYSYPGVYPGQTIITVSSDQILYQRVAETLAVIIFVILVICALGMIYNFYVCDNHTCKAFKAANKYPEGSKEQSLTLLAETGNDGVWPFALIGAAIITGFAFWLVSMTFTVTYFAIVFIAAFITIYALITFYNHHYLKPITKQVSKYINSTPSVEENAANTVTSASNGEAAVKGEPIEDFS